MPVKSMDFPIPIGLRVSRRQADKLDAWAAKLGVQRAVALRLLIEHAELPGIPAVRVDVDGPLKEARYGGE